MTKIINKAGREFEIEQWDKIVGMMDAELLEIVHSEMAPCPEQDFFMAYEVAHEAKYGEEWELSKHNPVW